MLLVTGAMGHVGFAIVRQAAGRGIPVLALHRRDFRPEDAHSLGDAVTWRACDLTDAAALTALVRAHPIQACIHAAAISNEAYARPNPLAAINANIGASARLLEAARLDTWQRLVLVSTGSVFQNRRDTVTPIAEDAAPEPDNVYGTTKSGMEQLARMYRRELGVSAAVVRISWVFGPPVATQSPTRGPIPSYLLRALRGEPIREPGRDFSASFTYVEDAASGLLAAALAPALHHPVYHLGHGVNFSAGAVAEAVRRAVPGAVLELDAGTEPWTRYTAMRAPLAGTLLSDDTGFAPAHSLEAGVQAYADWLRLRPALWHAE